MNPTQTLFVRLHRPKTKDADDEVFVVECEKPEDQPLISSSVGREIPELDATIVDIAPKDFDGPLRHRIGRLACDQWMAMFA